MKAATASSQIGVRAWTPTLRSVELTGPAGRLEAIVNLGAPVNKEPPFNEATQRAQFAALVCHPNPNYGGTMHNKVVYHVMKVFNDPEWGFGWPVLRFNFRGTGRSEGARDGKAEVGDVLAALDWLDGEYNLPMVVAGFSFGSAMALWACCGPQRTGKDVRAVIALGLPTHADGRDYHYGFLRDAAIPKLFVSGDRDEYGPKQQLEQVTAAAADPKQLALISDADHFFTGQLEPMQRALSIWLRTGGLKEQWP